MSYKSAPQVLATFTEQVGPFHKHITLFWIPSISATSDVPAFLHTPNCGPRCHKGSKIQSLPPKQNFNPLKLNLQH